jgi:hypothetical protein
MYTSAPDPVGVRVKYIRPVEVLHNRDDNVRRSLRESVQFPRNGEMGKWDFFLPFFSLFFFYETRSI